MKRLTLSLAVFCGVFTFASQGAEPVWAKGRADEMNVMIGFRGDFMAKAGDPCVLRLTGSSVFRIYVNGTFAGYGPARGPNGTFRVDEWDISRFLRNGSNAVAVEVSCYNVYTFYYPKHPAFLEAEVLLAGKPVLSTPTGFRAVDLPRVRKCSRYSYQRGFGEAWTLTQGAFDWRTKPVEASLPLEVRPAVRHLPRVAPYPEFACCSLRPVRRTRVNYDAKKAVPWARWVDYKSSDTQPERVNGFVKDELDFNITYENRRVTIVSSEPVVSGEPAPENGSAATPIAGSTGALYDVGRIATGFFGARIEVTKPGRVGFAFDEVLTDGQISAERVSVGNVFFYDFTEPGTYRIENFEPNTYRWLHVYSLGAELRIAEPYLREYKSPLMGWYRFDCEDAQLQRIFEAARETMAQNAVDVFTDCPGRERAGWLCDSWFNARSSYLLSGSLTLEDLFLSNYADADGFPDIEKDMLPMCYPADFVDHGYIPNWAMWLVLEVDDYRTRGGDRALIKRLRPRIFALVDFLKRYRNADGLLEKLPSWVFVEWSRANKLVQDVNYPSNMTWAEVLDAVDRLYGRPDLAAEAARVRETVRRQSWTGEWFCDNAVRQEDGTLKLSGECTETCQYYAFFFRTATAESHPALWKRLVTEFGPDRYDPKDRKKLLRHKEIWPSNAFIGNYLRLELLSRAGLGEQVVKEIRGYFDYMATRTGTLWENDTPSASCCHGFASYVAVLLARHANRTAQPKSISFCGRPFGLALCHTTSAGPLFLLPMLYEGAPHNPFE